MSDAFDEEPHLDPLVVGLTRPPNMLGVPYTMFVLECVVVVLIFLNTKNLLMFGLGIPLHGIAYALTAKDQRLIDTLQKRMSKCPRTMNYRFWGGDSYSPQ